MNQMNMAVTKPKKTSTLGKMMLPDAPSSLEESFDALSLGRVKSEVTILLCDDEEISRIAVRLICEKLALDESVQILEAKNVDEAKEILSRQCVHVLILDKDIHIRERQILQDGIEAIPEFLAIDPLLQILMLTADDKLHNVVKAMQLGALGYISKGTNAQDLLLEQVKQALSVATLKRQMALSQHAEQHSQSKGDELAGSSRPMRHFKSQLRAVAKTSSSVLLLGETGTGKTTAARYIHEICKEYLRQEVRPFYGINISALSQSTVERELFGHDEGAFTGAGRSVAGFFELANNGTLFLDEIGDASLDLQVKLLKVIEEGTFFRLGSTVERKTRLKLICATHRNLEDLIDQGKFREDLFMRISTFPVRAPSLTDRREDIPEIISVLLPKIAADAKVAVRFEDLPKDLIEYFKQAPIRGNIRGLVQMLTRLLVFLPPDRHNRPQFKLWPTILEVDLSHNPTPRSLSSITLSDIRKAPLDVMSAGFTGLNDFLGEIEGKLFDEACRKFSSNRDIARALGVSEARVSLYFKVRDGKSRRFTTGPRKKKEKVKS